MSEKGKRTAGILLIVISVLLLLVSMLQSVQGKHEKTDFALRIKPHWQMGIVPTERNGNIRVNSAGAGELVKLDGIGEKYASLLIEERQKHGPFFYPEDLEAVKGIGPRTMEKIRQDIDLTMDEGE